MHGRLKVKTSKEQEDEEKTRQREKAYHFKQLTQKLFDTRPTVKDNFEEVIQLTTEILTINPDFYTAWNIRREGLIERDSNWREELMFTLDCLKKNEKSYSVWQHRIWVLSKMPQSEYESELLLCNAFLAKDERNFHCWDYRNYISDLAKCDLEQEFQFTTDKIKSNFSNFSAWHRRHKLLIKGLSLSEDKCPKACDLRHIWDEEYNMVLNALFTDPTDQSPWLYHNWLAQNNFGNLKQDHLDKLTTLKELEPDNKWVDRGISAVKQYLASD